MGPGDADLVGVYRAGVQGPQFPSLGRRPVRGAVLALCGHSPAGRGVAYTSLVAKQDPRQVVAQGGRLRKRPSLSWPGLTALLWGGLQALGEACRGVRRRSLASLLRLAGLGAGGSDLDGWSRPRGQRPGQTATRSQAAPPTACPCRPPDAVCEGPGRGAGPVRVGARAVRPGPRQGGRSAPGDTCVPTIVPEQCAPPGVVGESQENQSQLWPGRRCLWPQRPSRQATTRLCLRAPPTTSTAPQDLEAQAGGAGWRAPSRPCPGGLAVTLGRHLPQVSLVLPGEGQGPEN